MQAFYSDTFVLPLPAGPPFPDGQVPAAARAAAWRRRLHAARGRCRPATANWRWRTTPAYVEAVLEGTLSTAQQREIGFPWTRAHGRALAALGGRHASLRRVRHWPRAWPRNLAGGTHHASADKGGGYCVFNDVAVAARLMQAEWHRARRGRTASLLRVAVIDLDVHQGNGTAAIFRDDPTVFTLSMHGAKNFPFRKEPSDLDVELPDGCTDAALPRRAGRGAGRALGAARRRRRPAWCSTWPAPIPHEGDRLGRLKLTRAGLAERDRRVFEACRERGIPVAVSMAGGYGRRIEDTVDVQERTLIEARASWLAWRERSAREQGAAMEQCGP